MKNMLFFIILFSILFATTINIPEDYSVIQGGEFVQIRKMVLLK